jgi:hypothetical protein
MSSSKSSDDQPPVAPSPAVKEEHIESGFIGKLQGLKYEYQPAEMVDDNKRLFRQILDAFLGRYQFAMPDLFERPARQDR